MRGKNAWETLLRNVQLEGQPQPLSDEQLDAFECSNTIKLPRSFRDYCKVFGPGDLRACIWVHLAAPCPTARKGDGLDDEAEQSKTCIEALNRHVWSTSFAEIDEYCANPDLVKNGLFFASDIYTHHYFWHRGEVTSKVTKEMAIYVVYREFKIHRLANSFESFIIDICLKNGIPGHGKLDYDPPEFEAAEPIRESR